MKCIKSKEMMEEYLHDESKKKGSCDAIYFPETEEDVIRLLSKNLRTPITVQGGRTGVTAGCVPEEGIVLNLSRMSQILDFHPASDGGTITVQPGLLLQSLRQHLKPYQLFFPPDPTETTASLGGMVSCNASGARSFRYGAVRNYVLGLDVILPCGDKIHLERGRTFANDLQFHIISCGGHAIDGTLPDISMPPVKKHTAGYHIRPDMDLIDLFIGAEGTLGIITAITLKLLPAKKYTWGAILYLPTEQNALRLVKKLRSEIEDPERLPLEALEYFGSDALTLLKNAQQQREALTGMETIPADAVCALYIEYAHDDQAALMDAFTHIGESISHVGGDPQNTWAAIHSGDMEKLKEFRHAVPECINRKISCIKKTFPHITKLSTDMAVPDYSLVRVFSMYRQALRNNCLDSAVFGHIGDNHIHVNVIPRNTAEYQRAKALFARWAADVVAMDGTVSAEHGIGKLKTALLKELYSDREIAAMKALKKCFDPRNLLNRSNIFR